MQNNLKVAKYLATIFCLMLVWAIVAILSNGNYIAHTIIFLLIAVYILCTINKLERKLDEEENNNGKN